MTHTIYLMPNLLSTKKAYDDMLAHGADHAHIHVMTKNDMALEYFNHQKVSFFTYSDIIPSLVKGAAMGVLVGSIGLWLTVYLLPSFAPAPFYVPSILLVCAILGSWVATMIGISTINPLFQRYADYVAKGWTLLMIDYESEPLTKRMLDSYKGTLCETF